MTTVIDLPHAPAVPQQPLRIRAAISVLVSRFPRIDETYILREINELERQGQPVVLVPLKRDHGKVIHEEAKPWLKRALYLPALSLQIIAANVKTFATEPRRYMRLLLSLVAGTAVRPTTLAKTLALFPRSVYLARLFTRIGIRHVHAHYASYASTMAYIIASLSDTTYSFTVHGPDIFVRRLLLREKIARAKFVRAVSIFNKAFLCGLYPAITEDKIQVVHMGVNPDVYAEAVALSAHVRARPLILSAAAMTPSKGFPFLVEACAQLRRSGLDIECRVVGDGPLRNEVKQAIRRLDVADSVRLMGPLPQHEVARLLAACDVFVLPSVIGYSGEMDGIPISLMEAMAAGRPVVASALSGIPELVEHEVSGILVDATHPERVASSVRRLIEDPALREAMGKAGQRRVQQQFDLRQTAASMIHLFDRHHEAGQPTAAEQILSLDWGELQTCALGIQRVRERTDSFVAELTITDGVRKRDVVVKQQRPRSGQSRNPVERARHEFEILTMLRKRMGSLAAEATANIVYTVPTVRLFDARHAAIVMDRARGTPVETLIRTTRNRGLTGRLLAPLRRAGMWLRVMQDETRSGEGGRELLTEMIETACGDFELAAAADRVLRRHRERTLETLRSLAEHMAAAPLPVVGHHGDFWPGNVFVSERRVDVIDFEGFRQGLALEDVAYFLVHMEMYFAYPLFRHNVSRLTQAFLTGYAADGAPIDDDALRLFKMAKALQVFARGGEAGASSLRAWWHRRALRRMIVGTPS